MVKPGKPIDVQMAGQKILAKIRRGAWDEIDYFFTSARWTQRGKKVGGISPIMRVQRVIFPTP